MSPKCVHHWRLEEPNGRALVSAVCLKCGDSRDDFKTSIDYGAQYRDDLHFTLTSDPRLKQWW